MFGYAGKMLFVNLSTSTIEERALDEEIARLYMGGPALGAKVLFDEMPGKADVFGEDSIIGFVTGPLNSTKALFGGRYTVVSKSPVTGGWNDANSGGHFGPMLKQSGFDAVFVKGISKTPVYIYLENGRAEIRDASSLWGLTTLEVERKLREKHGDKINAALIGPAGESLTHLACVMNDGHRAAGRGGSGAVMGSKKLKALVVKGNQKIQVADEALLVQLNKEIQSQMRGPSAPVVEAFGAYGTGAGYVSSVLAGDAGIKNWGGVAYNDYPEEVAFPVSSQGMDKYKVKKYNCSKCPLGCGAIMSIPSERWNLEHSPRPEYETQGVFGSGFLNNDVESICRANDLCNEYGLDTISAGGTMCWVAECCEHGVLTADDLGGIYLKWGDGDAMVALMDKICRFEGVGRILAHGSQAAADYFGKGHEFLVTASGVEEPQHDSRLAYGLTRTYQYDPTPGRHVKGGLGMGITHTAGHDIDYKGTGFADVSGVVETEICNSSGFCLLGMLTSIPQGIIIKLVMAVTGFVYSSAEIRALGMRMFNMRHAFNLREGKRRKDFTLSRRMYDGSMLNGGPIGGNMVDHNLLAENFFNAMGWDMDCVPSRASLEMIGGLDQVIQGLGL